MRRFGAVLIQQGQVETVGTVLHEDVRAAEDRVKRPSSFCIPGLVAQSSGLSGRAAHSRGRPLVPGGPLWAPGKALFPRVFRLAVFMLLVLRSLLNEAEIVLFQREFLFLKSDLRGRISVVTFQSVARRVVETQVGGFPAPVRRSSCPPLTRWALSST